MSGQTALLELDGLTVTYRTDEGPLPAVRGVDLTVGAGEVVGLAGESGCGKSTVAATVLRLQPRDAVVGGRVLVQGQDVLTMRWGDLRALLEESGFRVEHVAPHFVAKVVSARVQ